MVRTAYYAEVRGLPLSHSLFCFNFIEDPVNYIWCPTLVVVPVQLLSTIVTLEVKKHSAVDVSRHHLVQYRSPIHVDTLFF